MIEKTKQKPSVTRPTKKQTAKGKRSKPQKSPQQTGAVPNQNKRRKHIFQMLGSILNIRAALENKFNILESKWSHTPELETVMRKLDAFDRAIIDAFDDERLLSRLKTISDRRYWIRPVKK